MVECLPIESCFREDLISHLKRMIISSFCLTYNFKKALLGTNAHKVASDLLSSICKGRGSSLANEISYVDDKNFGGRVSFMNPMRDFLEKEIALYNHNRGVKIIFQEPLAKLNQDAAARPTNSPAFGSTDLLIQGFFSRLQDKYNVNTVPTVVRLTSKLLKPTFDPARPYPFCPLCLGVRDKINNLLEIGSTIKRIEVSEETKNDKAEFITASTDKPIAVESSNEWFKTSIE